MQISPWQSGVKQVCPVGVVQHTHHRKTTLKERNGEGERERDAHRDKEGERENGILMSQPSRTTTDAPGMSMGIHSTDAVYSFISTG